MMESAVPLQIGYGYGFGNEMATAMPAATWRFAESYYPYMRFGLAFTLMQDGWFTHEFGDSSHGQDWYYDELGHKLGLPTSAAHRVTPTDSTPTRKPALTSTTSPGLGLSHNWSLWVDPAANATLVWDPDDKRSSIASARVTVNTVASTPDRVDLHADHYELIAQKTYQVSAVAVPRVCP